VGLAANSSGVTVSCPSVADKLKGSNIPAASRAGIATELANLERQIIAVNTRLATEPGVAGSLAADLKGKRNAVIERIILDITRVGGTAPSGLQALAECSIAGAQANNGGGNANNGGGGNANAGGNNANAGGAVAQRVNCPSVEGALPAIPAQAQAEVTRNLNLLQTQIDEANARLARLAVRPEGGPAFVQNAILGPLKDKRFATLDRIQIAIGRVAAKPTNLTALAACTAVNGGAVTNAGNAGGGNANAGGNNTNAGGAVKAQRVSCPVVTPKLPAVPASARAEVDRNLALLRTQINEANARLARLAVRPEGGPAFVQNAILGPLEDKRFATLNRIEIAIGRTAARPNALSDLAPCRAVS
jgi:hypothetical protein